MLDKVYLNENVYDATVKRLNFVFSEFNNIIISFSGGKDSGILLHLTMDYIKRNHIKTKPILLHQDMEAQYQATTDYVISMFELYKDRTEPYLFCLPIGTKAATNNRQEYWYTWDDTAPEIWCRKMPDMPYVYNLKNHPMGNFYRYKMFYKDHLRQFSRWIQSTRGGKTCAMAGVRALESKDRHNGIIRKINSYKKRKWFTYNFKNVYMASPLYDWTVEDIWTAYAKFGWAYNPVYNGLFKIGVPLKKMRVASPFGNEMADDMKYYKALEPETWEAISRRIKGVSFTARYGGTEATGRSRSKAMILPEGYTWRSYAEFLIKSMPKDVGDAYKNRLEKICRIWRQKGTDLLSHEGLWKDFVRCVLKNDHYLETLHPQKLLRGKDRLTKLKNKYKNI